MNFVNHNEALAVEWCECRNGEIAMAQVSHDGEWKNWPIFKLTSPGEWIDGEHCAGDWVIAVAAPGESTLREAYWDTVNQNNTFVTELHYSVDTQCYLANGSLAEAVNEEHSNVQLHWMKEREGWKLEKLNA
jgi:hypothetical protein